MRRLRTQAGVAIALGVLSLVAMGFSHLALTDIARGEVDASLEWFVVQASGILLLLFTILSLATLTRVLKLKG